MTQEVLLEKSGTGLPWYIWFLPSYGPLCGMMTLGIGLFVTMKPPAVVCVGAVDVVPLPLWLFGTIILVPMDTDCGWNDVVGVAIVGLPFGLYGTIDQLK